MEEEVRQAWSRLGRLGRAATLARAQAQTLRVDEVARRAALRRPAHDWSPASDIVNMIQDTLVALDWDGKTSLPYLAKSWTISADGKLYTFKLRDDVTFCSGKKFTAADVIYSVNRLSTRRPRRRSNWRAASEGAARAGSVHASSTS